jgi:hypothetical protein
MLEQGFFDVLRRIDRQLSRLLGDPDEEPRDKLSQRIPPHPEDNTALIYVIEGSPTFTTDEGDVAAPAGDLIEVAHGGIRGIRAETVRVVVLATAAS